MDIQFATPERSASARSLYYIGREKCSARTKILKNFLKIVSRGVNRSVWGLSAGLVEKER